MPDTGRSFIEWTKQIYTPPRAWTTSSCRRAGPGPCLPVARMLPTRRWRAVVGQPEDQARRGAILILNGLRDGVGAPRVVFAYESITDTDFDRV